MLLLDLTELQLFGGEPKGPNLLLFICGAVCCYGGLGLAGGGRTKRNRYAGWCAFLAGLAFMWLAVGAND